MQGIHAQIQNSFASGVENYIIAARIHQGHLEFEHSTHEERADIIRRWDALTSELAAFKSVKTKLDTKLSEPGSTISSPSMSSNNPDSLQPSVAGSLQHRTSSFEGHLRGHQAHMPFSTSIVPGPESHSLFSFDNPEVEHAIHASVADTSRGNESEDCAVEAAIRESLAQTQRDSGSLNHQLEDNRHALDTSELTDEEFQALVQHAVEQSMSAYEAAMSYDRAAQSAHQRELDQAMRQSLIPQPHDQIITIGNDTRRALDGPLTVATTRRESHSDDDEMRRIMQESEQSHKEALERQMTAQKEEDAVLEYVKRQSLVAEGYRKQIVEYRQQRDMGKARGAECDGHIEEHDKDLRIAIEESMGIADKLEQSSENVYDTKPPG